MVFPISEIDLTFNNFHEEIPYDVVDIIKETIYETSIVCPEYVDWQSFH